MSIRNELLEDILSAIKGESPSGGVSTVLIDEASLVAQKPTGLDTPLVLTWGNGADVITDDAILRTDGTLELLSSKVYGVLFDLQYGRTGASGQSKIWFTSRLSFGGAPFVYVPYSIVEYIENVNDVKSLNRLVNFEVDENIAPLPWIVELQVIRDSSGNHSGGVLPQTSSLAGVPDAPSARVIINVYE